MTPDTERALKAIEPIAEELNIKVSADDRLLYIDDIAVGISCNSTYATLMEFIGYLILCHADDRRWKVTPAQKDVIERYWVSQDALAKIMEGKKNG